MIVPSYWSEAAAKRRIRGKLVSMRRFGWSDESQEAARLHAESRLEEAFRRLESGERLIRREPKVAYNGADGVPIREEIVERFGDAVVTRNAYGARCLNTDRVLFADIDLSGGAGFRSSLAITGATVMLGFGLGWWGHSFAAGIAFGMAALVIGPFLAGQWHKIRIAFSGGEEIAAMKRVVQFLETRPDWSVRVYRTPAGFRLMATHRPFSADDPEVQACFEAWGTDPVYRSMCLRQSCFRARLSAKPWRIGMTTHLKPRPGVWPVSPERLGARQRWIDDYERSAQGYASCQYLETLGSGMTHPEVRQVLEVHDRLSGAESGLPLA